MELIPSGDKAHEPKKLRGSDQDQKGVCTLQLLRHLKKYISTARLNAIICHCSCHYVLLFSSSSFQFKVQKGTVPICRNAYFFHQDSPWRARKSEEATTTTITTAGWLTFGDSAFNSAAKNLTNNSQLYNRKASLPEFPPLLDFLKQKFGAFVKNVVKQMSLRNYSSAGVHSACWTWWSSSCTAEVFCCLWLLVIISVWRITIRI